VPPLPVKWLSARENRGVAERCVWDRIGLPDANSEAVVLHLMQQAWPGRRIGDELAARCRMKPIDGARRKRGGVRHNILVHVAGGGDRHGWRRKGL
jgi:hypothetical protein